MSCSRTCWRSPAAILSLAVLLAISAHASGPNGVDIGWSVNNNGAILLTPAKCAALAKAGAGWLRVSMRLIPGHDTWDPALFDLYDAAVNNARQAGLQVILLIDGESWRGGQSAWTANNYENTGGNGDNDYMEGYANGAVAPIVQHFRDRTKIFELWNEPNAWTSSPSPGVYSGGSFVYPSNFAALLVNSWVAVHVTNNISDVTLFAGGVFGHSIGGVYSYGRSGAQYIEDTYNIGINVTGSFTYVLQNYGSYPLDGIGQHIYIDQGGLTTAAHIQQYLDWVRQAYTRYEGADTVKKVFITELGWTTKSVSPETQAADLRLSFQTIINGAPWVQSTIWFNWQDQSTSCTGSVLCYGVIDSAGNPKPSYTPYQYYQSYEGAFADGTTQDAILTYYNNLGKPALGNPYDNGHGAWVYVWGDGYTQDSDGGSDGKLGIMSSGTGTFEVNDLHGMWSFYLANDGIDVHGYPVNNEYATDCGTRQDFETGYYTWDPTNGVVEHQETISKLKVPTSGLTH